MRVECALIDEQIHGGSETSPNIYLVYNELIIIATCMCRVCVCLYVYHTLVVEKIGTLNVATNDGSVNGMV